MLSRRLLFSSSVALCAALGLASYAISAGVGAACRDGTARGDWDLPTSGQSNGFIYGSLYLNNSTGPVNSPVYTIFGTLTDAPSPCLSCIEGSIDAYLDDGFGPAPDYIVRGAYSGLWFTGRGSFSAEIYTPTGAGPVGRISGVFSDPPTNDQIGEFKAEWAICP
jgi:hypothetical protein